LSLGRALIGQACGARYRGRAGTRFLPQQPRDVLRAVRAQAQQFALERGTAAEFEESGDRRCLFAGRRPWISTSVGRSAVARSQGHRTRREDARRRRGHLHTRIRDATRLPAVRPSSARLSRAAAAAHEIARSLSARRRAPVRRGRVSVVPRARQSFVVRHQAPCYDLRSPRTRSTVITRSVLGQCWTDMASPTDSSIAVTGPTSKTRF
jgi:hypothetical protein